MEGGPCRQISYKNSLFQEAAVFTDPQTAPCVTAGREPTRVRARVDLEVLGACEHLAAVGKRARERLLPGVHADVVDEFIFGFERLPAAQTLVPHADVTEALQPRRDVLAGDVVHELGHGAESLLADAGRRRRRPPVPRLRRTSLGPSADQFGFDGGAFGEIQQAVHPAARRSLGGSGAAGGSGLGRGDDAGSPGIVVPQRRDEAIVPGHHHGHPLHAPIPDLSLLGLKEKRVEYQ